MKRERVVGDSGRVRYWVGVASKDHVARGVADGFCQLCHGKSQPLARMSAGDWLIYYSPKERFGGDIPCQQFTAIGEVTGAGLYAYKMSADFTPHRRDIRFQFATSAAIKPLLSKLGFIRNQDRWGYAFRFGHFEISQEDFLVIATVMLGFDPVIATRKRSKVRLELLNAVVTQ